MAYAESRIGKVQIKQQGAWGTAATSFTAANLVECEMTYPTLLTEAISTEAMKGNYHHDTVLAGSEQGTTFELRFPLHGWDTSGVAIEDNPDVANNPEVLMLQSALGGLIVQGYTENVAGGSTSVVNITDGFVNADWIGSAQLYDISGGNTSVGWVKSVDGSGSPDTVTPLVILAGTPQAGTGYGSATTYLDTGTPLPLTVQYMGANEGGNGVGCELVDCVVTSFKISLNPREQLMCDVSLIAGSWSVLTSNVTDQYTYSYNQMGVLTSENGARMVNSSGVAVESFTAEVTIENTVAPVGSVSGAQGISQFASTNRAVTFNLTVPATSSGFATNVFTPGQATGAMQIDICQGAGKSFSAVIPSGVITEQDTIGDQDGLIAITRVIGCAKYASDGASTDAGNKAFRIALL